MPQADQIERLTASAKPYGIFPQAVVPILPSSLGIREPLQTLGKTFGGLALVKVPISVAKLGEPGLHPQVSFPGYLEGIVPAYATAFRNLLLASTTTTPATTPTETALPDPVSSPVNIELPTIPTKKASFSDQPLASGLDTFPPEVVASDLVLDPDNIATIHLRFSDNVGLESIRSRIYQTDQLAPSFTVKPLGGGALDGTISLYLYRLKAYADLIAEAIATDRDGNATTVSKTIPATEAPPTAPAAPIIAYLAGTQRVEWQAVPQAVEYVVYRDGQEVARVTGIFFEIPGGWSPGIYQLSLRASNQVGLSDFSNEVTVTVAAPSAGGGTRVIGNLGRRLFGR
jgi:hypothetical protein